jgi:hypothetical protein
MSGQPLSEPLPIEVFTEVGFFDSGAKDPINLVYAGELADLRTVLDLTERVLDCTENLLIGDQVFAEPSPSSVRHQQDFNRASSIWSGTGRYHTRFYQVFATHQPLGRLIASPIHIDTWDWCGFPKVNDVAKSFNDARDHAVELLRAAGWSAVYLPLGMATEVLQCNGHRTPCDDQVAVIADKAFLVGLGYDPDRTVTR